VIPTTGAYLAGADLRMDRTMGISEEAEETLTESFP
jgi:hypothetical protein